MTPHDESRPSARLRAIFVDELADQLGRLTSGLEVLAAGDHDAPRDVVGELFRAAHSLKGAAQAAGAPPIAALCHQLEEELARLRDGETPTLDPDAMATLGRLVDRLGRQRARYVATSRPDGPVSEAGATGDARTVTRSAGPAEPRRPAAASWPTRPRVSGDKLDGLISQAGNLLALSYSSQAVPDSLHRLEDTLRDEQAHRRAEREVVLSLVTQPDRARVAEVLHEAQGRTLLMTRLLDDVLGRVHAQQRSLRGAASAFAESVRKVRMVPFETATAGLRRQVAELSAQLGKEARLEISASDVEVDTELVLTLRDVLGHLVRNAVDHGLEPPAEREAAGKRRVGSIRVTATLGSDGIRVQVSDDGRGVDEAALQAAASERRLVRRDGGHLSGTEAMFLPGVSTATAVTGVSGRGVGLDAVRAAVEGTGGSISVSSERGSGTDLTLLLPLNLSTIRVLVARAGEQLLCLPSATVERLLPLGQQVHRLGRTSVVTVDGDALPVARLGDVLGWAREEPTRSADGVGILAPSDSGRVVLAVDEVVAEREIVLRAASRRLAGARAILGTTQLGDSSLLLVLNPQVCFRAVTRGGQRDDVPSPPEAAPRPRILLVEDSLTTRELERSLLEDAGYQVLVAHDGQQAWDLLQAEDVDAVVSDVNMPRMDGIALCEAIRASGRIGSLPVVLVTSLHSDADRRAGLDAGADAYLTKAGFDRDELVAALRRLL